MTPRPTARTGRPRWAGLGHAWLGVWLVLWLLAQALGLEHRVAHGASVHADAHAAGHAEAHATWGGPHEDGDAQCRLADALGLADAAAVPPPVGMVAPRLERGIRVACPAGISVATGRPYQARAPPART